MNGHSTRRHVVRASVWLALAGAALAGPWWAETHATETLQTTLGGNARVQLDVGGLRASNVAVTWGHRRLTADEVTVHPTAHGLAVHVAGPQRARLPRPPLDAPTEAASAQRVGPTVPNTHGVAVTVRTSGRLPLSAVLANTEVEAAVVNPVLQLDGRGGATVYAEAEFTVRGAVDLNARGAFVATKTELGWTAQAEVAIADGPPIALTAQVGHRNAVTLTTESGGRLQAVLRGSSVRVQLDRWPLAVLGRAANQRAHAWGVDIRELRIDGGVTVDATGGAIRATLDPVAVSGLTIDHRALAPGPVRTDRLSAWGEVTWSTEAVSAQAVLEHRGAQLAIAAQVAATRAEFDVTLPTTSCQAILTAMPDGFADAIAGTQLDGDLRGHLRISIDRERLRAARRLGVLDRDHPPGTLSVEFPFLESCTVVGDAPTIDFAALDGPYRHRFVSTLGHAQTRVMAAGAPGFATLGQGRLVADALITLEDYRFWDHDGFDRPQIEHAFWHNLVAGRVRRGASTISQQATRNLWLGIDRSAARKVQEALLTARLEARVRKERILELYINLIELGPGVHGVAEGARFYFGKEVGALTPLQAVHLAALAPAPRRFAGQFAEGAVPDVWMEGLREHLRRMRRARLLTRAQLNAALVGELGLVPRS